MPSVFELAGERYKTDVALASFKRLDSSAPKDYRELAVILVEYWRQRDDKIVGLSGGQGAGKSTLSDLIRAASQNSGEQLVVLGIDDFYLTQSERNRLATEKHELFATRGPPGTHDISRLLDTIEDLVAGRSVKVPQFDKGADERSGTRRIDPPCHRVLVEGWCVGASPQPESDLTRPMNALERDRDPRCTWRRAVNALPYRWIRAITRPIRFSCVFTCSRSRQREAVATSARSRPSAGAAKRYRLDFSIRATLSTDHGMDVRQMRLVERMY